MTERARREYAAVLRAQYTFADKRERRRILDEYCRTTRCHRKSAIRCLGRRPSGSGRHHGNGARSATLTRNLDYAHHPAYGATPVAIDHSDRVTVLMGRSGEGEPIMSCVDR